MEGATGATGKWHYKCERAADVLESGAWSDCSFIVGTEKEVFKGHKQILALASPVFETMFFGNMPEDGPVLIDDVHPDTFKILLTFIYTDIIDIKSVDEACDLCYVANKYMLQDLVMLCSKYLQEHLEAVTACRIYETANLFDMEILRDKCIEIISKNTKEVLNEPNFDNVDVNTLVTVFSLDTLNIESEVELIETAARYAKARDVKTGDAPVAVDSSSSSSAEVRPKENGHGARLDFVHQIRGAIENIRFLTVPSLQFSESSARLLLPMEEVGAVLMNIVSSNCGVPMPQGLSTSKEPRKKGPRHAKFIYFQRAQQLVTVKRYIVCTAEKPLVSNIVFSVDDDILLLGVQITEKEVFNQHNRLNVKQHYIEGGDWKLSIETEDYFTRYGGVHDVMFSKPIIINKHQQYMVEAQFPQGSYPEFDCLQTVRSESVTFTFYNNNTQNNELFRSLIWRYPNTT